ncbi:MAG TPA: sigma-70 family RNA polymerase sigma factor [Thermoanaerobaculia bacterium]|nr:sigma-70 family RNA polymerase sigma factor [Thermoanaerobaculia bacterium]
MTLDAAAADRLLVRRMLRGDERAFSEFFDASFPGLYRFALVRLGYDADAAEEAVQSVLCKAVAKLHTYRGEAALFTWLCTICRREIAVQSQQAGRRQAALVRLDEAPEVRAALDALAASEEMPEGELLRKELGDLVRLALDNLPVRYAAALEWKYIEGESVREIAHRLELGPKAAESLLTRARSAFREAFATLCGGLDEGRVRGDGLADRVGDGLGAWR